MNKSGRFLVPAMVLVAGLASPAFADEAGSLRVGAARVDITPKGDPAYPASGRYAHERLYVRAIVLDNGTTRAALVGADLGGLGEEVWAWPRSRSPRSSTARWRT